MSLDAEAARTALETLDMAAEEAARGIVRVANAEMVRALRVMTVERGVDPRDFALLAFGGAGGLHAAAIADELGIDRIVFPRASGVLSALGLAAADRRVDVQRTVLHQRLQRRRPRRRGPRPPDAMTPRSRSSTTAASRASRSS